MKPSWNDAPEWAQWLAMDADGIWWWFERKPYLVGEEWMRATGKVTEARPLHGFDESLEPRP